MNEQGLGTNTICQVGLIVRDIERSLDRYCQVFGMERPPVSVTDEQAQSNMKYQGQPSPARAKLAFFNLGQVSLELIEPLGAPSTWQAFLDEKGEGVHHIAFFVKGTDQVAARLEGLGIPVQQQGDYTGGRYTYLSSEAQLGVALELLENFGTE